MGSETALVIVALGLLFILSWTVWYQACQAHREKVRLLEMLEEATKLAWVGELAERGPERAHTAGELARTIENMPTSPTTAGPYPWPDELAMNRT